ncbi:MC024.1 [Molluscum contagiosum virus subtype 1]|uniref:MC024.1R n=1 Tax=Molluscum contagiosum virus TaxID=10279 RepID=A0A858A4F3_9POXV|nr:MC024.1 [Molluscum contagiosum virus subtype 1]QHW17825.1 MC024.1R [Molluscum contagiosum virus]AYO88339.1 MC024.1 [Molluscum contagiosum virus subtype 1]AYO88515.1 MC024.1 [Molluscum contagiosum virus subtype 1]AYO88869.1 MC024.1 [Molluscum contagiosum virus subtype 1]
MPGACAALLALRVREDPTLLGETLNKETMLPQLAHTPYTLQQLLFCPLRRCGANRGPSEERLSVQNIATFVLVLTRAGILHARPRGSRGPFLLLGPDLSCARSVR